MSKLDSLLSGEEPREKKEEIINFGLTELYISRYAYEKAFRYAHLILQNRMRNLEIAGYLTKPEEAVDRVARDAFLVKNQKVNSDGNSFRLEGIDVINAKKELEKQGQKIIGWWHSHGRGNTFHSETDKINQMTVLNQIAPSNYIFFHEKKVHAELESRVENNKLVFWDPKNPATRFELDLKNANPELVAQELRLSEEKRIGFAYSFVVNKDRWLKKRVPYCEIATRNLCRACVSPTDVSIPVGYRIFDYGEFNINDAELKKEIEERVHICGNKRNRKYFLPATFEQQRAAGKLTKPRFAPSYGSWPGTKYFWSGTKYSGGSIQKPTIKPKEIVVKKEVQRKDEV